MTCAIGLRGQDPGGAVIDPAERELKMLAGQLADPARTDKTKLEAAELLLLRNDARAVKYLADFLLPQIPPNPRAQIAVAEAVARAGTGRKEFVEPLTGLLTGPNETVRPSAARALATYKSDGVLQKLIAIAQSEKHDKPVRLAVIAALRQVLDRKALAVLVDLLDDPDPEVAAAAGDTLAKITNISAFRTNKELAKKWLRGWGRQPQSVLIAQLADSLARANSALETENEILRRRVRKSIEDLYAATPNEQRDAMLVRILNDTLGEVRLVGTVLAERRIAANEPVSEEARNLVRRMLRDEDVRCRGAAAALVAKLGDTEALATLLSSLQVEESPAVRGQLFMALGQLRDVRALPAVLKAIADEPDNAVASAATALGRIAAKQPLTPAQRSQAVASLVTRYQAAQKLADDGLPLRDALLGAMGALGGGDKPVREILLAALGDTAATLRLAAVNALGQIGGPDSAQAVAKLVADPDRGVRTAVLSALSALDGRKYLDLILARTTSAEIDDTVRQQAWEVAIGIFNKADAATLEDVLERLADRPDAAPQRIIVMGLLAEALRAGKSPKLPGVLRRLGAALSEAGRAAEAAAHFGEAYVLLAAAKSDQAMTAWHQWLTAKLAAGDVAAVKVLADQKDEDAFATGLETLLKQLQAMTNEARYTPAIDLAREAEKTLAGRLTAAQQLTITTLHQQALAGRAEADRRRVAELVSALLGTDASVSTQARKELLALGTRALPGLVDRLLDNLEAEIPSDQTERVLVALVGQISPKLTGYAPEASKADRIKLLKSWQSSS